VAAAGAAAAVVATGAAVGAGAAVRGATAQPAMMPAAARVNAPVARRFSAECGRRVEQMVLENEFIATNS
jgi:hypothetical protein